MQGEETRHGGLGEERLQLELSGHIWPLWVHLDGISNKAHEDAATIDHFQRQIVFISGGGGREILSHVTVGEFVVASPHFICSVH